MNGRSFWFSIATIVIFSIYDVAPEQNFVRDDCCVEYCYGTDTEHPQNKRFATNSAYKYIKGNEYITESVIPDCKPTRFWLLNRHGTRLPEVEEIPLMKDLMNIRDEIIENYEVRKTVPAKGALCSQDIALLKSWTFDKNITVEQDEYLTVQGWDDLRGIARDYQNVYPNLLISTYDESNYIFRYTNSQRTEASWKGFVEGLFGEGSYKNITVPKPDGEDTLILPWIFCPIWREAKNKIRDPGSEVDQFNKSPWMMNTILRISTRLGFETPLNFEQVRIMWTTCRYETAWFLDKPSPWCTAFTMEDVDVFEFEEDLYHQYKSGYANEMSTNLPCEVIQDLFHHMNDTMGPPVKAYFAHSTLMELLTVAFELNKDDSLLTSSNYESMRNRNWRTSEFDAFSSNVAAIRYDCSNSTGSWTKVKFFRNQSPLQLDGCNNGLCDLSHLYKLSEGYLNRNCTETFCKKGKSSSFSVSVALLAAGIILNKLMS